MRVKGVCLEVTFPAKPVMPIDTEGCNPVQT
jgi:hypothetical protein